MPRRQLGRYLRDLRNQGRLTVRAAAGRLEWSEAKIWRIESGLTSLRSFDVEVMCRIYGAPTGLTEALMGLAKETKARGWWHSYGDVIPGWLDLYIGLEEAASRLWCYQSELVPGLLQTEEYARTLIRADDPDVDDEEIDRRVHVRMARQSLLTRATDPPSLSVVLNESILHRSVGGPEVLAKQLERIADVNKLPNITIKVMPFSAGLHAGVTSGPFVVLRFPEIGTGRAGEPPTVYVEGLTGALYLEKDHEVTQYEDSFSAMWELAAEKDESTKMLIDRAGSLKP
nr:helix-turn-helix transcriptional regulator [Frankia sp. AgPm24]